METLKLLLELFLNQVSVKQTNEIGIPNKIEYIQNGIILNDLLKKVKAKEISEIDSLELDTLGLEFIQKLQSILESK